MAKIEIEADPQGSMSLDEVFKFSDLDSFEELAEKIVGEDYVDHNFQLEFVKGDAEEEKLFEMMGMGDGWKDMDDVEQYFDVVSEFWDDDDFKVMEILMDDLNFKFQDAYDKKDDLVIYGEFRSDADFAQEYVDGIGGIEYALGDRAEFYFDFEKFGRDLRIGGDLYDPDDPDAEERYEEMSDKEIGEEWVDNLGGVGQISNSDFYFDWDAFGRDLMMDMAESDGVYYDPNSVY
jgi:hypothetical protein